VSPLDPTDREIAALLEKAEAVIEINRSAKANARAAMRSAYIETANNAPVQVVTPDSSEIGAAELLRVATNTSPGSRWRIAALVAAASALAIFVGVSLIDSEREIVAVAPTSSSSVPTTTDSNDETAAIAAAEELGMRFMQARGRYDGLTLASLIAPDASFNITELAQTVEEIPLQADWERAVGWQFLEPSCTASSPEKVLCRYTIQAPLNAELGKGPYIGNSFLLEVSSGQIQVVSHAIDAFDFYTDTEIQFYTWVNENHPGDLEIMLEGDRLLGGDFPSFPRLNPESIRLWEARTTEYLSSLD